jgi:hypothetical protein
MINLQKVNLLKTSTKSFGLFNVQVNFLASSLLEFGHSSLYQPMDLAPVADSPCKLSLGPTHNTPDSGLGQVSKARSNLCLSNCNIDFFVFCHRFCIMSPRFLNFKRSLKDCHKISNSAKAKV